MQVKKSLRPQTARIVAAAFLLAGLLLGAFDAPQYVDGLLDKTGLGFRILDRGFPYRFGLDIQGGTHLVYQADLSSISNADYASSMEAVRDVIERRVNLFGVSEPVVQVEKYGNERRLIVELAGIKNIAAAIRLIGETPYLEFREERPAEERDQILEAQKKGELLTEDPYFVSTTLTGK